MGLKERIIQILLAFDQLFNTFIWFGESYADESFSARCYRMTDVNKCWNNAHKAIDFIFDKLFRDKYHCYNSYLSELERRQLPKTYLTSRLHAAFLLPKER